jgi:precorrin-6A/cobalt-precorrin-6A reductase
MRKVLVLGGTTEGREVAAALAVDREVEVITSLAGRVRDVRLPRGEVRIGGFGGVEGLSAWLTEQRIDALIDATHPFAAAITEHAAAAAAATGVPAIHLRRPGWTERAGDRWRRVADLPGAAAAVAESAAGRVLLTIGRQGVSAFAGLDRPWFLIRCIDPPAGPLPPRHDILTARGPFDLAGERALLADRGIELMVTKDSGGAATAAKLTAAREAGIGVVVVDRPPPPAGATAVESVAAALAWLASL